MLVVRKASEMLTGLKVLLVEDEFIIALDVADTLAEAGASVIGPVSAVSDALAILNRERVEAAVLDTTLRDGSILPVLAILVANKTPVVLYTGNGLPDDLGHLKDAVSVVLKPAPTEHLVESLSQAVKASRTMQ